MTPKWYWNKTAFRCYFSSTFSKLCFDIPRYIISLPVCVPRVRLSGTIIENGGCYESWYHTMFVVGVRRTDKSINMWSLAILSDCRLSALSICWVSGQITPVYLIHGQPSARNILCFGYKLVRYGWCNLVYSVKLLAILLGGERSSATIWLYGFSIY